RRADQRPGHREQELGAGESGPALGRDERGRERRWVFSERVLVPGRGAGAAPDRGSRFLLEEGGRRGQGGVRHASDRARRDPVPVPVARSGGQTASFGAPVKGETI